VVPDEAFATSVGSNTGGSPPHGVPPRVRHDGTTSPGRIVRQMPASR
jgi:hypothetical protein